MEQVKPKNGFIGNHRSDLTGLEHRINKTMKHETNVQTQIQPLVNRSVSQSVINNNNNNNNNNFFKIKNNKLY